MGMIFPKWGVSYLWGELTQNSSHCGVRFESNLYTCFTLLPPPLSCTVKGYWGYCRYVRTSPVWCWHRGNMSRGFVAPRPLWSALVKSLGLPACLWNLIDPLVRFSLKHKGNKAHLPPAQITLLNTIHYVGVASKCPCASHLSAG